ncbi:MAG: hypothetical protein AAF327_23975 [Cyanobacteria bacterium P01_A01_bin.37]
MVPDSKLMDAIAALDYRVTVGDVATQSGLAVRQAEQGLLALASEAGGHLQVSETGDIVYLFPKNFRAILRNASLSLRLKALRQRIWGILFYLIRISFGILLIASLIIVGIAVMMLVVVYTSQQSRNGNQRSNSNGRGQSRSQVFGFPFSVVDLWRLDHYRRRAGLGYLQKRSSVGRSSGTSETQSSMGFLEAIFSFLFGDGDPNADLGDRRWQMIAGLIRNHDGAVTSEQLAPYLDLPSINDSSSFDPEDYVLPVLQKFNGRPEVSPTGGLIYHFPALQVMAKEHGTQRVSDSLQERPWRFSLASQTQLTWAAGLGAVNLAVVVAFELLFDESLMQGIGGLIGLVEAGYWVFFAYAIAFLLIPAGRYLWLRRKNHTIEQRNLRRVEWASQLDQPSSEVKEKMAYAKTFTAETVISADDLAYTTEMDLATQELLNADTIDQDWRQRLEKLL